MNILAKRCKIRNQLSEENLAASSEPVDPRRESRPVRGITRDNTKNTSRRALSLVIRGRRRNKTKSSRKLNNKSKQAQLIPKVCWTLHMHMLMIQIELGVILDIRM